MNAADRIRYIDHVGTTHEEGITAAGEFLKVIRATISRQAAGFFTIDEASQILSDATGSAVKTQLEKLRRAIDGKTLHALDQDDKMPVLNTVRNFLNVLRASDMIAAGFMFPIQPQAALLVAESVVAASDGPAPLTTAPAWSLITPPERMPGYRWPLYQFLSEAHDAGKPCPKAQEVLDAWKLNPPSGVAVIKKGRIDLLEFELFYGGKKTADLRAIQASIKALLSR